MDKVGGTLRLRVAEKRTRLSLDQLLQSRFPTAYKCRRAPCAKGVLQCDVFRAIGVSFERKADSPNY